MFVRLYGRCGLGEGCVDITVRLRGQTSFLQVCSRRLFSRPRRRVLNLRVAFGGISVRDVDTTQNR